MGKSLRQQLEEEQAQHQAQRQAAVELVMARAQLEQVVEQLSAKVGELEEALEAERQAPTRDYFALLMERAQMGEPWALARLEMALGVRPPGLNLSTFFGPPPDAQ